MIRDFVHADISDVIEIVSHRAFSGYRQFRPHHQADDVNKYIDEAIEYQKPDPSSEVREVYRLAICLKENQQVIGCCIFHGWTRISKDNDQIGYFLHPFHQRKGYVQEATQYLLSEYFSQFPDRPVYATAHPFNIASSRVLEKLGFSKFGTKTIEVNGVEEPRVIYSVEAQNLKQSFHTETLQRKLTSPLAQTANSSTLPMTHIRLDGKAR